MSGVIDKVMSFEAYLDDEGVHQQRLAYYQGEHALRV